MDLMSVLTAVTHPGVDPEVPDARDPESAAAFTELLATLVAAPGLASAVAAAGGAGAAGAVPTTGDADGAAAAVAGVAPAAASPLTAAAGGDPAAAFATAGAPAATSAVTIATGAPGTAPTVDPSMPQSAPVLVPEPTSGLAAEATDAVTPSVPALPGVEVEGLATTPAAGDTAAADGAPTAGVADGAGQPAAPAHATPVEQPRQQSAAPDLASSTGQPTTATDASAPSTEAIASPATAAAAADSADDAGADTTSDGGGIHALDAAQRTESASPVAAPSAPAETAGARALERALAMQLAHRVGTLSQRPDGEYDLTLQLEPADLGRLELRVRMEGGLVHIQVGAHAASTTEAIRAALPELRDALADAGLNAGSLDVGTHTGQSESGASRDRLDREGDGASSETHVGAGPVRATPTATLPTLTGADRGVDVLL